MNLRGMYDKIKGAFYRPIPTRTYELMNTSSASFYPWDGEIYNSDIARSAIWTIAKAAGKASFVHTRGHGEAMQLNPDQHIRALLRFPNEYQTMQIFISKMVVQLEKHNNAFARIVRDPNGRPLAMYPLNYSDVELQQDNHGELYCKFNFRNAKSLVFPYRDIIHLQQHLDEHEVYGASNRTALENVMEIITTSDKGMVAAVKNGAAISWLMKFAQILRPNDKKSVIKEFSESYLKTSVTNSGVLPTDPRYDLEPVEYKSYVPNAAQMDKSTKRLLMYFGVNEKIIMGDFDEDEWNSFYELTIEPILMQFAAQLTFKLFTSKERAFGNEIQAESTALQYASTQTKLSLVNMVDRGAMLVNEWRRILNLAPIEGGDKPIRRLDTRPVDEKEEPNSQPLGNLGEPQETEKPSDETKGEKPVETKGRPTPPENAKHDWVFEVRAAQGEESGGNGGLILEGRPIVFDTPTVICTIDGVEYKEVIARGALDGADMSDVPLRYNHSQTVMIAARHNERRPNRSTMEFIIHDAGVDMRADVSKVESGRQLHEAVDAGLIDKMSFAFTVDIGGETYDETTHTRTVTKIKKLWDVSAVDTPAYDTTSIYARDRFKAEAEAEKRNAEAERTRRDALSLTIDTLLTIYDRR